MVFGKEFRSYKPFLAKSIAVGAGLMLALVPATQCLAVDQPVNFKIYSPQEPPAAESTPARTEADTSSIFEAESPKLDETPAPAKSEAPVETPSTPVVSDSKPETTTAAETKTESTVETKSESSGSKVLQGYIRVVPTGTKIPIIMDTAVDSDTSQEGDEFSARTSEDLTIDGSTVVPAGSIIKGRIAQMNGPRALNRSGSVALKFDTITTPDNRQIPLVANIVARGGVVHARRGMKDVALDCGTVSLPTLCGLGIGVLAGNSSSSSSSSSSSGVGAAGGAMIGAGIGLAVGVAVLLAKKGKKVEVRPGDELKIELAEDLRMPTM
ncbi:MAG: hypothetical protein SFV17_04110 [Candidatus Obscuribacter sp.]|nr:hypothetical protein [Candidatus Melainabacteria bacterium]MDX1985852.1 hypothetical protein [Candidatus Obscuribacter sp.]